MRHIFLNALSTVHHPVLLVMMLMSFVLVRIVLCCDCCFTLTSVHSSTYSNCTDGDIKLLNGSTEYEGRVEICINKAWGTITYFYGTSNEAQTVCNQLGYTAPGTEKEIM